jgi:SsrA-binding protein
MPSVKANTESFVSLAITNFAINTYIEEYNFGNQFNHHKKLERKLLNKRELKSLERSVSGKGSLSL